MINLSKLDEKEKDFVVMCDVCGKEDWILIADKDGNVTRADCKNNNCNNNHILLQMRTEP